METGAELEPSDPAAGPWVHWQGSGLDERFGEHLKDARTAGGLSQVRLAALMATRGFAWHQTTVARTESGARPVLLKEALALAEILHQSLDHFTAPEHSAIDKWIADSAQQRSVIEKRIRNAEREARRALYDLEKAKLGEGVALALKSYAGHKDSGRLSDELELAISPMPVHLWGFRALFEAVGISSSEYSQASARAEEYVISHDFVDHLNLSARDKRATIAEFLGDDNYRSSARRSGSYARAISQSLVEAIVAKEKPAKKE
ncbi:helix-turn-helix domain-containing protein [Kitasatospora sp. NPDC001574]